MPFFMRPGLDLEEASAICTNECRAMCCRGPLVLELVPEETSTFAIQAEALGIDLQLSTGARGEGWVKFAEHPGQRCPMLDPETFRCRIYDRRPDRCRRFPEKPTPGCQISGG